MNNKSGGVRISAILIVVIIVLLLAVGFGVFSQKKALNQRALESADAQASVARHHKIPQAPQPVVQTEDAADETTVKDRQAMGDSETGTYALSQTPSPEDDLSGTTGAGETDSDLADTEPQEPTSPSEKGADAVNASISEESAEDRQVETLEEAKPEMALTEQTASMPELEPQPAEPSQQTADAAAPAVDVDVSETLEKSISEPGPAYQEEGDSKTDVSKADAAKEGSSEKELSEPFFTIQTGAYRSLANAERNVAEMQKAGYDAYVHQTEDASSRPWFLVRFGRFDRRTPALEQLNAYNQEHQAQAILTRSNR